jgi:hypothetical protein
MQKILNKNEEIIDAGSNLIQITNLLELSESSIGSKRQKTFRIILKEQSKK